MSQHLDASAVSAAVAGLELEPAAADHLASCLSCRRTVAGSRAALQLRRDELALDTPDWDAQRRAILDRLPARTVVGLPRRRRWRPLVALAATLLVGALGLGLWRLQHAGAPPPPTAAERMVLDQALAQADALLADDSIPGFEPIDPFADSGRDWTDTLDQMKPGGAS